jgi:hypothetical protein
MKKTETEDTSLLENIKKYELKNILSFSISTPNFLNMRGQ